MSPLQIVFVIFIFAIAYCGCVGANAVLCKWYGIQRMPLYLMVIWPFTIIAIGLTLVIKGKE